MIKRMLGLILIYISLSAACFFGYVGYNTIIPSLAGTGISLTDVIFHSDSIPPDKFKLIDDKVVAIGNQLGSEAGSKFSKIFDSMSSAPKVQAEVPYPYPNAMATVESNWRSDEQASKVNLQKMQEWDQTTLAAARKQSLENAQNAEKTFAIVRAQTLSPQK